MFGFKSKPKIKTKSSSSSAIFSDELNQQQRTSGPRRLSLSGLRPQRSNGALKSQAAADMARITRSRSLSNEAIPLRPVISDTLSAESINKLSRDGLSSQPLIHLLSLESEARRQRQDDQNPHHHHQQQPTSPGFLNNVNNNTNSNANNNKQFTCITDALLPLSSTITEWTPLEENPTISISTTTTNSSSSSSNNNNNNNSSNNNNNTNNNTNASNNNTNNNTNTNSSLRQTRLKFELPTTPLRAKSPVQKPFLASSSQSLSNDGSSHARRGKSPRKSRWGIGGSNSDVSDDEELVTMVTPVIGAKVELLRRPLPTLGTIKYVGSVSFARGTWVGVELESRCKFHFLFLSGVMCYIVHVCVAILMTIIICMYLCYLVGKNDGQIEGVRYFRTDPQRGVFVKIDDFKVISLPHVQTI